MSMLIYFDEHEAKAAAEKLRTMPTAARKLLADCIETQGVTRTALSAAARSLENEGFIFVRDFGDCFGHENFELSPTLAGEEAMDTLETMNNAAES